MSMVLFVSLGHAKTEAMNTLDLSAINQLEFPSDQYFKEVTEKTQVCLHHTASGRGVSGDYGHWLKNKSRIATCVIVDSTGVINQLFSSKYWGWHLGIPHRTFSKNHLPYKNLNKSTIGLEIDAWGGLKYIDNEWRAYPNDYGRGKLTNRKGDTIKVVVDTSEVVLYPNKYRGYKGFQKYTDAQIESTRQLLVYWGEVYNIPLDYDEDMWDVNIKALKGSPGITTHNSYRKDKSDCHPQKELVEMLKSLA